MFSTIYSGGLDGIRAYLVQVEVHISTGLPGFGMVGSLSGEVREARERVQVALRNAGFDLPPMKITVNLAPAHIRKEGTAYDLPIAVGMLAAMGYFDKKALENVLFAGELGLDGEIKPVRGIFPIVQEAARSGLTSCIISGQNAKEGALAGEMDVRGAENINQVVEFLQESGIRREKILPRVVETVGQPGEKNREEIPDFADVSGQEGAKRAAEIAAAGFHNLLMVGPPGAGKSMIAKRIPGIMPPLTRKESMEVSAVYSVAGLLKDTQPLVTERPFQSPHHTVTMAALTGGSGIPRPGIMSLAHRGVLFLDELPEFSRAALDCMRQPLEDKEVHLAKAYGNVTYPADFMLVCAMNPCVCGYYPDRNRCRCTEGSIRKYLGRVSGPVLDRIDLCVEISPVNITKLRQPGGESSAAIRERVMKARHRQEERFSGTTCHFNGDIKAAEMEQYCPLGPAEQKLMEKAYETMQFSARGYHRILRVARTIADLAGEERIREEHLLEAVCYRTGDCIYWGGQI